MKEKYKKNGGKEKKAFFLFSFSNKKKNFFHSFLIHL